MWRDYCARFRERSGNMGIPKDQHLLFYDSCVSKQMYFHGGEQSKKLNCQEPLFFGNSAVDEAGCRHGEFLKACNIRMIWSPLYEMNSENQESDVALFSDGGLPAGWRSAEERIINMKNASESYKHNIRPWQGSTTESCPRSDTNHSERSTRESCSRGDTNHSEQVNSKLRSLGSALDKIRVLTSYFLDYSYADLQASCLQTLFSSEKPTFYGDQCAAGNCADAESNTSSSLMGGDEFFNSKRSNCKQFEGEPENDYGGHLEESQRKGLHDPSELVHESIHRSEIPGIGCGRKHQSSSSLRKFAKPRIVNGLSKMGSSEERTRPMTDGCKNGLSHHSDTEPNDVNTKSSSKVKRNLHGGTCRANAAAIDRSQTNYTSKIPKYCKQDNYDDTNLFQSKDMVHKTRAEQCQGPPTLVSKRPSYGVRKARQQEGQSLKHEDTLQLNKENDFSSTCVSKVREHVHLQRINGTQRCQHEPNCTCAAVNSTLPCSTDGQIKDASAEKKSSERQFVVHPTTIISQYITALQDETQVIQSCFGANKFVYSWHNMFSDFLSSLSLASAGIGLPTFINILGRALRAGAFMIKGKEILERSFLQNMLGAFSGRKAMWWQKLLLATIVLAISVRFGNKVHQGLDHERSSAKAMEEELHRRLIKMRERMEFVKILCQNVSEITDTQPT